VKDAIFTDAAPEPIGPYSQGIMAESADRILFVSGQIPIDPKSGEIVGGDITVQGRQAIENVIKIVEKAGGTKENIVKITVYLRNMKDFESFNRVYGEYFGSAKPARAVIGVSGLPRNAEVEIEAIAVLW